MSDDMVLSYAVIILLLLCLHGAIGDRLRPSQSGKGFLFSFHRCHFWSSIDSSAAACLIQNGLNES